MKRRSLDRTLAKQFPERFFTSPLEIVGETLLTRGEKLGTLNRWHRALLDGPDATGAAAQRARTLGQIEEARCRLNLPSI